MYTNGLGCVTIKLYLHRSGALLQAAGWLSLALTHEFGLDLLHVYFFLKPRLKRQWLPEACSSYDISMELKTQAKPWNNTYSHHCIMPTIILLVKASHMAKPNSVHSERVKGKNSC